MQNINSNGMDNRVSLTNEQRMGLSTIFGSHRYPPRFDTQAQEIPISDSHYRMKRYSCT